MRYPYSLKGILFITSSSNGRTSGFGPLNGSSNLSEVTTTFFACRASNGSSSSVVEQSSLLDVT